MSTSEAASSRPIPKTARSAAGRAWCTWSPVNFRARFRFGSSGKNEARFLKMAPDAETA